LATSETVGEPMVPPRAPSFRLVRGLAYASKALLDGGLLDQEARERFGHF